MGIFRLFIYQNFPRYYSKIDGRISELGKDGC